MSNPHAGHRERAREEVRRAGAEHLPDHRLLELLLYHSIPRADTNVIAHYLLERFGSISGVFDAPYELLAEVEGVGKSSATMIMLISAVMKRYMDDYSEKHNEISTTAQAKEYMRYKFLCMPVECVYMVCIGANNRAIFCDVVAEGAPETVQIRPVDLIRKAIMAKAVRVVLAHNHPHGISTPSRIDLQTTNVLYQEFKRVDIELFDHIIIAADGACSMKELGMLP